MLKRKEPDKEQDTQALQNLKITPSDYNNVKTSLGSIMKNKQDVEIIKATVLLCHNLVSDAYLFVRLYILKKYHEAENKNEVELPSIDANLFLCAFRTLSYTTRDRISQEKKKHKRKEDEIEGQASQDRRTQKKQKTLDASPVETPKEEMKRKTKEEEKSQRKLNKLGMEQDMEKFYEDEFEGLVSNPTGYCRSGLGHVLPYLATQMVTSYHNNIKVHFMTRLLRFINITAGDYERDIIKENSGKTEKELSKVLRTVRGQLKKAVIDKSDIPDTYKEWAAKYLAFIVPREYEKNIGYDLEANPDKYIPCTIYMNWVLEERNPPCKLFQPLSIRTTNVPCHITLDTACLVELFFKPGKTKTEYLRNIKENQLEIWTHLFNLKKEVFYQKNSHFHYLIHTDGISVSLSFRKNGAAGKYEKFAKAADKPKDAKKDSKKDKLYYYIDELSDNQRALLKNKKIVGVDPGKFNLVYMVDEKWTKLRYTARQRRHEAKSLKHHQILLKKKKRYDASKHLAATPTLETPGYGPKTIEEAQRPGKSGVSLIDVETALSKHNACTVNYQKFKDYIAERMEYKEALSDFYGNELFRKWRWRQYVNTKKSEEKFLNKVEKTYGKDIVLAYGNWSRRSQMKHFMPTMGAGLRKLLSKRFETVSVDEYNTSKLCCNCKKELKHKEVKKGGKKRELFRCLVCEECERSESKNKSALLPSDLNIIKKERVFLTRDVNSAMNILKRAKEQLDSEEKLKIGRGPRHPHISSPPITHNPTPIPHTPPPHKPTLTIIINRVHYHLIMTTIPPLLLHTNHPITYPSLPPRDSTALTPHS